jgi:hypothetical protein
VEHDRGLADDPALAVVKADLQIPQDMTLKVQSQFAQDNKKARIPNNSHLGRAQIGQMYVPVRQHYKK